MNNINEGRSLKYGQGSYVQCNRMPIGFKGELEKAKANGFDVSLNLMRNVRNFNSKSKH
jgi:hypothetical protein